MCAWQLKEIYNFLFQNFCLIATVCKEMDGEQKFAEWNILQATASATAKLRVLSTLSQ